MKYHTRQAGEVVQYVGSQDWGPAPVVIVKPWGGLKYPLYVVALPDGRTYVADERDFEPAMHWSLVRGEGRLVGPGKRSDRSGRTVNVGSAMGGPWWGVPAAVVVEWIEDSLSRGRYGRAGVLSALLHA